MFPPTETTNSPHFLCTTTDSCCVTISTFNVWCFACEYLQPWPGFSWRFIHYLLQRPDAPQKWRTAVCGFSCWLIPSSYSYWFTDKFKNLNAIHQPFIYCSSNYWPCWLGKANRSVYMENVVPGRRTTLTSKLTWLAGCPL